MNDETFSLSYTLSFPPSAYDHNRDLEPLNEGDFTSLDRARDVAFEIASEIEGEVWITEHFGQSSNLVEIIEG